MSTTEGRRDRMQRIISLFYKEKRPLTPNEIGAKTEIIQEVTKERLYIYLENLVWIGLLSKHGNTYSINFNSSINRQREREREKEKKKKQKKELETK